MFAYCLVISLYVISRGKKKTQEYFARTLQRKKKKSHNGDKKLIRRFCTDTIGNLIEAISCENVYYVILDSKENEECTNFPTVCLKKKKKTVNKHIYEQKFWATSFEENRGKTLKKRDPVRMNNFLDAI